MKNFAFFLDLFDNKGSQEADFNVDHNHFNSLWKTYCSNITLLDKKPMMIAVGHKMLKNGVDFDKSYKLGVISRAFKECLVDYLQNEINVEIKAGY